MGVTYINPYRFGVPFSPLDLSPQAWYDASDTSTITSSGGAVSQWNDKSGNGRNVTQATAASQPTTGSSTLNGLNVLSFDGGDFLQAATASHWKFLHDGTVYIVAMVWQTSLSNPNRIQSVLATAGIDANRVGFVFGHDDRAAVPFNDALFWFALRGSGTPAINGAGAQSNMWASAQYGVLTTMISPGDPTAANRALIYRNSSRVNGNETSTTAPSTANPSFALIIGRSEVAYQLTGQIAELIFVSGANATEANRVALRDYLNAKWAVY